MSHDEHHAMSTKEKLIYMANQIAAFFQTMPHDEAAAGVAKHINDFWDPRMRRQFFEIVEAGGKGCRRWCWTLRPRSGGPRRPNRSPEGRSRRSLRRHPRWRQAKSGMAANLPPCGGDVRQDRGGQRAQHRHCGYPATSMPCPLTSTRAACRSRARRNSRSA